MKAMHVMLLGIMVIAFAAGQDCFAEENVFVTELRVAKNAVSSTEPIYTQWMVKNMGDNALPLMVQRNPYLTQPAITYRLWIKSISNSSVDISTFGALSQGISEVRPHSDVSIWSFDLRRVFGKQLPRLRAGVYRISVDGTWEGMSSFWAEMYFVVKA